MTAASDSELLANARRALVPSGWSVEIVEAVPPNASTVHLHVAHVLSGGCTMSFEQGSPANADRLQTFLDRREFALVRDAPASMPHGALIGSLRQLAGGMQFGTRGVVALSRVLRAHDVLADDEAAWLEDAGPAFDDLVQRA